MNKENQEAFLKRFNFFETDKETKWPFPLWGFECADGWKDLLWKLCEEIEVYLNSCTVAAGKQHPFRVLQVKEKFGGLRFYCNMSLHHVNQYIDVATEKASKTCEKCGAPGELRPGGWVRTLCDSCNQERN